MAEDQLAGDPRAERAGAAAGAGTDAVDASVWGKRRSPRRQAFVAVALMFALWPAGGATGSGGAVDGRTPRPGLPSRQDAVAVAAPQSPAVAAATDRVGHAREVVDQLRAQLGELQLTAFQDQTQVLPAAVEDLLARTRTEQYADVAASALAARVGAAQHALNAAEHDQQQALAEYFTALAAEAQQAEQAARAAREQVTLADGSVSVSAPTGSCAGAVACFLACTRAHESDTAGGYRAVSPDGVYHGAYQFDQTTWDSVASSIGRPDLVGVDPATARPTDQDTLATALYAMRGNQPWGGRC
jgi:hypothetical protein